MLTEIIGLMVFRPAILADGALTKQLSISQVRITGDEYIVLKNTTNSNLQLSNYWLQYFNEFNLSTPGVTGSSSQLPAVTLQPNQEILLSAGVAANCGQIWVSKLPFTLKDSGGLLQVVAISQNSGIIAYKPEDQVSWSSKATDAVDVKGVTSSSTTPIWFLSDGKWSSSASPPGCAVVAGTGTGSAPQAINLIQSSASPPSLYLEPSETQNLTKIPSADAGLIAPQLSEILPNPASPKTDANDEYIEFYNPNDQAFDLSGFKLKAGTDGAYSYTFSQSVMQPHEFKAFYASQTNLPLSNTSGKVSFISPDDEVLGSSDIYTDAKDDQTWVFADGLWQWTTSPTPGARNLIPAGSGVDTELSGDTSRPPVSVLSKKYPALRISELLPHPQKPQTDANDEYIELYNPSDKAVNLSGYILKTGLTDNHKYAIKNISIAPKSYKAFYRKDTNLTLSNTAGHAVLTAPDGTQIDKTADYSGAKAGLAWIYAMGKWQWTTIPTPGRANLLSAPAVLGQKTSSTAAAKSASPAGASLPGKQEKASPLHPAVLAGVGSAALIYGLYEYRNDLANLLYKLRRNREVRRIAG